MRFACNVTLLIALIPMLVSSFKLNQIQNYNQIPENLHPLSHAKTFINSDTDRRPFIGADPRIFQAPSYGPSINENMNKLGMLSQERAHRKNIILDNTIFLPNSRLPISSGLHTHEQTGSKEPATFSSPPNYSFDNTRQESYPIDDPTLNLLNRGQQESIGAETAGEVRLSNEKSHSNRNRLSSAKIKHEANRNVIVEPIKEGKKLEYGKKMKNQRLRNDKKQNPSEETERLKSDVSINNSVECNSEQSVNSCGTHSEAPISEMKIEEKNSLNHSSQQRSLQNNRDNKETPNSASLGSDKVSDAEDKTKLSTIAIQNKVDRRKGKSKEKKNDLPESVVQTKSTTMAPEMTEKKSPPTQSTASPQAKLEPKLESKPESKPEPKVHKDLKEDKEPSIPHHIELHAHNHFENHHHISLHTKLHRPTDHAEKFSSRHPPLIHLTPQQSPDQYHENEFEKSEHVKGYQHYEPVEIHMNHGPDMMHGPHLENVVIEDHSELETYHRAPDVTYQEDVISHPYGHGISPIGHSSFIHPMFHG